MSDDDAEIDFDRGAFLFLIYQVDTDLRLTLVNEIPFLLHQDWWYALSIFSYFFAFIVYFSSN
jgi:hypothetical protein